MQQPLRIALLQMDVVHGDPDANFRRAQEMIEEVTAAQEKPDVIVMPEMWNTGYSLANIKQIADVDGQRTKQVIGDLARQAGVHIVAGSVANLIDGDVYNTIFAFDRQGEVQAQYSKIHLFRLLEEEKYLKAGNQLGKLNLDGTQAGMMICYDIRFPELSRRLGTGRRQATHCACRMAASTTAPLAVAAHRESDREPNVRVRGQSRR